MANAMLSFFLGPVQSFISAARTTRDLWTGSYLLSWLTAHAMKPILDWESHAKIISPSLTDNPLAHFVKHGKTSEGILTPCIPNNFKAMIENVASVEDAQNLAKDCVENCQKAWKDIAQKVRQQIQKQINDHEPDFRNAEVNHQKVDLLREPWDRFWDQQIESLFEMRTAVLDLSKLDQSYYEKLLDPVGEKDHGNQISILVGMLDAAKSLRHVPAYLMPDNVDVPQKCSLLGTYEQMGPAQLEESRKFWELFADRIRIYGSRTRPNERLCAISLVKRFAWPCFLAEKTCPSDVKVDRWVQELAYSDTATLAASCWMPEQSEIDHQDFGNDAFDWKKLRRWSGQWLHWTKREQDPDEKCPVKVWKWIQDRKNHRKQNPPAYYGILMFDADNLGNIFSNSSKDLAEKVSNALSHFALQHARQIVEKHKGELIYCGGDDTLAIVPAEAAIACAMELREAYEKNWEVKVGDHRQQMNVDDKENEKYNATVTAGLAIVHYKEDLRFAMQMARNAEHDAKQSGRNALGISVCRRSGEHTIAFLGWDQASDFNHLVAEYQSTNVSDRWTYVFRRELPGMECLPHEGIQAEVRRLLNRLELEPKQRKVHSDLILGLSKSLLDRAEKQAEKQKAENPPDPDNPPDEEEVRKQKIRPWKKFAILCQSAAFMSRGRDDR